jgi:predicted nucleotidyltransferase component of viral defense system
MIHHDKEQFAKMVDNIASQTGFHEVLMEKDYYLTLLLSQVSELSEDLIFKGGTCLNKIYYSYYRLSEDLDFSMRLPAGIVTRGKRRQCMEPVKAKIEAFALKFGMRLKDVEKAGRNESKQYIYIFVYDSALMPSEQYIKFEIGLRMNPICNTENKRVQHKFLHPFTQEPLFEAGYVHCLSLNELVAEKLRAAALRKSIVPRDFYDLNFILNSGFDLIDQEVTRLFEKKIEEEGGDSNLSKYRVNLGRSESEIEEMRSRIENELFDVLTLEQRKNFDLDNALNRINKAMARIKNL